jgi:hypothetical protein
MTGLKPHEPIDGQTLNAVATTSTTHHEQPTKTTQSTMAFFVFAKSSPQQTLLSPHYKSL